MERLYKPAEAAVLLSVSRQTVYRWIAEGRLQMVRVNGNPRIRESDIKKIIKED